MLQGHAKRRFSAPQRGSLPIAPGSRGPQEQQEELREQTSSSHQHKTSLLCPSGRCNCFHPWMSESNDIIN